MATIVSGGLCPRDKQALEAVAIEGASACAKCGGLWLTREALMAQARRDPSNLMGSRDDAATDRMALRCPKDDMALRRLRIELVEIDICPNCFGAWLAKGELAKIRQRSAGVAAGQIINGQLDLAPDLAEDRPLKGISDWIHEHWPTDLPDTGTD